jgi:site-specific recombinase XerD
MGVLRALHQESINTLVQKAVTRAGMNAGPYNAHSLRAGFVTYAHLRGASDRAIAHQTPPRRSLATLGAYVRVQQAWTDDAATALGLSPPRLRTLTPEVLSIRPF